MVLNGAGMTLVGDSVVRCGSENFCGLNYGNDVPNGLDENI